MVTPVTSGVSSYTSPQPNYTSGAEARTNTQDIQPRQAPAAESQRGDQRLGNREEDRRSESRSVSASPPRAEASNDSRRGSNLDVVV